MESDNLGNKQNNNLTSNLPANGGAVPTGNETGASASTNANAVSASGSRPVSTRPSAPIFGSNEEAPSDGVARSDAGLNKKRIVTMVVVALVVCLVGIGAFALVKQLTQNNDTKGPNAQVEASNLAAGSVTTTIDNENVTYNAAYVVDGVDVTIENGEYASTMDEQNVFLVINGGHLTIKGGETNVKINKSGSENFDGRGDKYSFYGTNSAIVVVGEGSQATIEATDIATSVSGANGIVAVNGGEVDVKYTNIMTTQDGSRGIHATYGGDITADNVTISTSGGSSATIATDRGEGAIEASNMVLTTRGAGSPLIYSTGKIDVTNSVGKSLGAQIAVVEGDNAITLSNCDFVASGNGNRNGVDNAAVMIYQSMSGDAKSGMGKFSATDSTLRISEESPVYAETPFFFITNTRATIGLTNVEATFAENEKFIVAKGTSEWGKQGNNGGVVKITMMGLTATNKDLEVDSNSSVSGM